MDKFLEILFDIFSHAFGILFVLCPLFFPKVRDFIVLKFQNSLDKALENRKSLNEKKVYISKVRFDKEFEIYQELSEKQIKAVYDAGEAVAVANGIYSNDSNKYDEFIDRFGNELNDADISLKRYAPFISKELYEKYKILDEKITDIYKLSEYLYRRRNSVFTYIYKNINYNVPLAQKNIENMQRELTIINNEVIENMRNYLNTLDVLE